MGACLGVSGSDCANSGFPFLFSSSVFLHHNRHRDVAVFWSFAFLAICGLVGCHSLMLCLPLVCFSAFCPEVLLLFLAFSSLMFSQRRLAQVLIMFLSSGVFFFFLHVLSWCCLPSFLLVFVPCACIRCCLGVCRPGICCIIAHESPYPPPTVRLGCACLFLSSVLLPSKRSLCRPRIPPVLLLACPVYGRFCLSALHRHLDRYLDVAVCWGLAPVRLAGFVLLFSWPFYACFLPFSFLFFSFFLAYDCSSAECPPLISLSSLLVVLQFCEFSFLGMFLLPIRRFSLVPPLALLISL